MLQSLLAGSTESLLASVAAWLVSYLLCSTVLLGAAWLLDVRGTLGRSTAFRVDVWTAAMVVPVLAATVQATTGLGSELELQASEAEKVVAEFPGTSRSPTHPPERASAMTPSVPGTSRPTPRPAPVMRQPHRRDRADPRAWLLSLGHDWPLLLALGWSAGAIAGLLLFAVGCVRLNRRLAGRSRVAQGPLRTTLDEVVRWIRCEERVELSVSSLLASPVVLPGREICLPRNLVRDLEEEGLRAVLAHELIHVVRRDTPRMLLLRLLRRLLFIQPLNRLALSRVRAAAEDHSDAWVRERGLGQALAGVLVSVAREIRVRGRRRRRTGLVGLARTPAIEARVRHLLRPAGASTLSDRISPWTASRLGILGVLVGALVLPGAEVVTPPHGSRIPVTAGTGGGDWAGRVVAARSFGPRPIVDLTGGRTADRRARLADLIAQGGGSLLVRLERTDGPVSVALRPGGSEIRIVGPDGRTVSLAPPPGPEGEGWLAALRVPEVPTGRWELHLPSSVRRLDLEVAGQSLRDPDEPAGGELPALVDLP